MPFTKATNLREVPPAHYFQILLSCAKGLLSLKDIPVPLPSPIYHTDLEYSPSFYVPTPISVFPPSESFLRLQWAKQQDCRHDHLCGRRGELRFVMLLRCQEAHALILEKLTRKLGFWDRQMLRWWHQVMQCCCSGCQCSPVCRSQCLSGEDANPRIENLSLALVSCFARTPGNKP